MSGQAEKYTPVSEEMGTGNREVLTLLEKLVSYGIPYREFKSWLNRAYLQESLKQAGGNQSKAARNAGLHRNTFQRLMHVYNIQTRNERAKERREQRARQMGLRG